MPSSLRLLTATDGIRNCLLNAEISPLTEPAFFFGEGFLLENALELPILFYVFIFSSFLNQPVSLNRCPLESGYENKGIPFCPGTERRDRTSGTEGLGQNVPVPSRPAFDLVIFDATNIKTDFNLLGKTKTNSFNRNTYHCENIGN